MDHREKTGQALKQEARRLGVSTDELATSQGIESEPNGSGQQGVAQLAHRSWMTALIAALASLVSAITALYAVIRSH